MKKNYEAPVLTEVGPAEEVILGTQDCGDDLGLDTEWEFEFEQD